MAFWVLILCMKLLFLLPPPQAFRIFYPGIIRFHYAVSWVGSEKYLCSGARECQRQGNKIEIKQDIFRSKREDHITDKRKNISILNLNDLKNESNFVVMKKSQIIIISLGNKRCCQLGYRYAEFQLYAEYLKGDYKTKEDLSNNNNKTIRNTLRLGEEEKSLINSLNFSALQCFASPPTLRGLRN